MLVRCKAGDLAAFRQLVEQYQSYAFSLAFRLLYSEENAKDIVQECFIRIWKHLPKYNLQKKFTTWLYRIVTNLCYDRIKARNRSKRMSLSEGLHSITFPSDCDLESDISNKELVQIIENLARELSTKQRIIFTLRDLQDLDIDEVAQIAGMSKSSVKSNLYYARQNIRKKLE